MYIVLVLLCGLVTKLDHISFANGSMHIRTTVQDYISPFETDFCTMTGLLCSLLASISHALEI